MSLNKNNLNMVSPPESPDSRSRFRTLMIIVFIAAMSSSAVIINSFDAKPPLSLVCTKDKAFDTNLEGHQIIKNGLGFITATDVVESKEYNGVLCKSLNEGGWRQDFMDSISAFLSAVTTALFATSCVVCYIKFLDLRILPYEEFLTLPTCLVTAGVTAALGLAANVWHAKRMNGH